MIKAVAEDEAAIAKWGKLTDITLTKVGKNNPSGAVTVSLSAGTADEKQRICHVAGQRHVFLGKRGRYGNGFRISGERTDYRW